MSKDNVRMPMSTAGITSFYDDYHSKFEFKPGHVVLMCIGVIVLVILLNLFGSALLG